MAPRPRALHRSTMEELLPAYYMGVLEGPGPGTDEGVEQATPAEGECQWLLTIERDVKGGTGWDAADCRRRTETPG